jgi:hypothetical protein
MQIRKILLLVLLPILMSFLPNSLQKSTLGVKVEVVNADKGEIRIKVTKGEAPYKLELIGKGDIQVFKMESDLIILDGIDKGEYYFVVTDAKYRVGSINVKL